MANFLSPSVEDLVEMIAYFEAEPDTTDMAKGDLYWNAYLVYSIKEEDRDAVKADAFLKKALAVHYPPAQVPPIQHTVVVAYALTEFATSDI
jgi:hypothetical protein